MTGYKLISLYGRFGTAQNTADIFSLIPIMQKPRRVYEGKGFQRYFGEGYPAVAPDKSGGIREHHNMSAVGSDADSNQV